MQWLAVGIGQCRMVVSEHGGLLTSLFLAGLLGSVTHCVGMCGPFVLGQTAARLQALPASEMREFHRLAGAALVPYHLGRATTYAALGGIAASLAGAIGDLAGLTWLPAALLGLAALIFLAYALQRWGVRLPRLAGGSRGSGGGLGSGRLAARLRGLFAAPVGIRGYALGVALGFLPCGLLYGAIAAAAASGHALTGVLAMVAFTAGTVPVLVAIGMAGHVAGRRWQRSAALVTPVLLLLNVGALTYMAWRMAG